MFCLKVTSGYVNLDIHTYLSFLTVFLQDFLSLAHRQRWVVKRLIWVIIPLLSLLLCCHRPAGGGLICLIQVISISITNSKIHTQTWLICLFQVISISITNSKLHTHSHPPTNLLAHRTSCSCMWLWRWQAPLFTIWVICDQAVGDKHCQMQMVKNVSESKNESKSPFLFWTVEQKLSGWEVANTALNVSDRQTIQPNDAKAKIFFCSRLCFNTSGSRVKSSPLLDARVPIGTLGSISSNYWPV